MLNQVTIHQLELFLLAAKLKNFSRAADQMAISQPAFSAQIIKLERILGAPLFDRIDRKIEMTEVGAVFEEYVQKTLSTLREGKQVVDDMTHQVIGALKIGASTTIANYILPEYLGAYNAKYPNCKIEMMVNNTNQIEQALLKGEIDMGLVEGPIGNTKRINSYLFMLDELVVIFSTRHRWKNRSSVSFDDFQREPLIIRERGSGTRQVFTDMMGKSRAPLNIAMEIGNTEAIKKSAESGIGVAVISQSAINRELKEKTLKKARISGHPMERRLNLILLHKKYLSNPLKAFIALLDPVEKIPDMGI
ncbi:MAG TPA: LysR family transcriptional regulator [Nitrospirae bacterium]|nr:LysR family transcriptional regulator [Nitrospirota bacterium]